MESTYPNCPTCGKVLEDCGCDGLQSPKAEKPEQLGFGKYTPHEYVETNPYKGCGACGVGPGAFHHNSHEVKRYLEEKANPYNVQVKVDEKDPSMVHVSADLPPAFPFPDAASAAAAATRYMQKATLEKARRIQLMGRVDELKAALADAKRGFELELPGQWPERFNVLLEQEPQDPKDWEPRYDFKAKPDSPLNWPKGDPRRMPTAEEMVRVEPLDPFHELSSVLWFLASLTSDHEPGCIVKDGKGDPCDCDVTLREGEPWWKRVRASLSLPAALKARLDKAETKLKARRVVEVKPVAGVPGPNGDGTVYEFKMPEGDIRRLLVVRYEPGTLSPEQMRYTSEAFQKKLPGVLVLFAQPNWELTLLELPK